MKGKIFTAQEVQAILNKSKVMFREVIKPQPWHVVVDADFKKGNNIPKHGHDEKEIKCPYQVGQKIFCKESFWEFGGYDGGSDGDEARFIGSNKITFCPEEAAKPQTLCKSWKKRPAQHMKQEHSRLTLLIKEIRAERLAEISEEDCWKEGLEEFADYQDQVKVCQMAKQLGECFEDPRPCFATHWNATHKKPEEKFEANPWAWVVSFENIKN